MQIEAIDDHRLTVSLSANEVRILNNALNEALEALGANPDELATRMGANRDEIRSLLDAVHAAATRMR